MAHDHGSAEDIIFRFPLVYGQKRYNIFRLAFGFRFECGPGWLPLIDQLSQKIENIVVREDLIDFFVFHVGVNSGHLQILSMYGNREITGLIYETMEKSKTICEFCSKLSKIRNRNDRFTTRCNDCAEK